MDYGVRQLRSSDLDALTVFFKKAYGSATPFRSKDFLKWYFKYPGTEHWEDHDSWIAIDTSGNVVSHYGCLACNLMMGSLPVQVMWGVNAYTLPDWRGKGINSAIVDNLLAGSEVNGVIGFTRDTAEFYAGIGYNIFNYERLKRYVFVLDEPATREVVKHIGQDAERFGRNIVKGEAVRSEDRSGIIRLTRENIAGCRLSLEYKVELTTLRDQAHLMWRYLDNPFVEYELFARVENGDVLAMIASRRERLEPLCHEAYRIVDLYGDRGCAGELLSHAIMRAREQGCIYVDFSMGGSIYEGLPEARGFRPLDDEECVMLPQVCSPIGQRPNNEYFGFQSRKHATVISSLTSDDVYLTRGDSDRDRLGNLSGNLRGWNSHD